MWLLRKNSTLVTRFVIAFVCMNLGGAMCLTYCSQSAKAAPLDLAAMPSHCEHHKKQAKPPTKDNDRASAKAAACCTMPVSMIAAPVEERGIIAFADTVVVASATVTPIELFRTFSSNRVVERVYRPPPLDQRSTRLRNCVFRI
ncbi:MAG: hypothetical protein KA956_00020 [Pyrinomonadaceae bacterium]|nr:hypothetical protein [Acidobacteriota bacterium]MBP7374836.1 hypothetical protein [Pyrinomonadaceae bacterium]